MRHVSHGAKPFLQRGFKTRLFRRLLLGVSVVVLIFVTPSLTVGLLPRTRFNLRNHSTLGLLRSPLIHSDWKSPSWSPSNRLNYLGETTASIPAPNTAFDFFVPVLPQSGSSKIVFASNREGSMQIYVMNGDGSGVVRLTNSGANDDLPRWSPNGAKILFQSDRDHLDTGYMDNYVMNAYGGSVTRLTGDANDDSMATWSPDGTKIVFQSMRNGANYQVYSMNADGSNQVNLTNTSSSDCEPSWSPDGAKILFASDRDHSGYDSIYVMSSNGSNQQRLTFSSGDVQDMQPVWSPDGTRIAFVSTRDSTTENWTETDDFEIPEDDGQLITRSRLNINKEVYVMNADGSGQTRLTNELANDDSPSWSPAGSKIIWRSDRERDCCDPSAQIWTVLFSYALYYDDFAFTPELTANITSPRVSGPIDGTTPQKALLGANIPLQSTVNRSGGTYSWEFSGAPYLITSGPDSTSTSSVTIRPINTGTGTITAKLTYTLNGVTVSPTSGVATSPDAVSIYPV